MVSTSLGYVIHFSLSHAFNEYLKGCCFDTTLNHKQPAYESERKKRKTHLS
jgi:hypothetical protein